MALKYDCIIIGAGMSGLAAGIRLAMFNKKVLIVEMHSIPGGLNSYYNRGKRKFDVGLHALTNFVSPNERGKPFNKLMKQLRIPYEEFKLSQQTSSLILFPDKKLKFNNDINFFIEEIRSSFPNQVDGFIKLLEHIKNYDEVNLANEIVMAKEVVKHFITDNALLEMILAPLLIYGSAWENDMDFSQFVIMFKSIYIDGFSRPEGGVRTIINLLMDKYQTLGGEIRFKSKVTNISTENKTIRGIEINNSEFIYTNQLLSSMGLPETFSIIDNQEINHQPRNGNLSFCETILFTDKKPKDLNIDSTIIFYNNRPNYLYQKPQTFFDKESSVVCFPNNFEKDDFDEGIIRLTNIANYQLWDDLLQKSKNEYNEKKDEVYKTSLDILRNCGALLDFKVNFKDVFSPTTITRYTGHFDGVVYGSIDKTRNGKTPYNGLFIIGTDQGFLGIVGSMLSGISMANLHVLTPENQSGKNHEI